MKLKTKITLFTTLLLILLLLVTNSSIYFIFKKTMTDNAIERLDSQVDDIAEGFNRSGSTAVEPRNLFNAYVPLNGMIRIIDENNKSLLTTLKDELSLRSLNATYRTNEHTDVTQESGAIYASASMPIIWTNDNVVSLELTERLVDVEQSLGILRIILIVASFIILVPTVIGGRFLSKVVLQPIQSLIYTMEDIQTSRTFKRITTKSSSKDELDQMANTFNNMMDLLEENYKKQEQFVSDASHELKTPLTVIESYANMLKRWGMKRPDILEEAVESIHSESIRMKTLTEQMLVLAKDDSQLDLHIQPTDINTLCIETGRSLQQAFQRTIHVKPSPHPIQVSSDEQKLKQLLYILLDNAIKYSEESIELTVSTSAENMCLITITDRGIGIPKEDLAHVYERFFRVDKARNRETGGSGLGLAIAAKIIKAHQGTIHIDSEEGKGTIVQVHLPIYFS
ncbi:ATP-binding protein [Priestia flexa]|uniref:sensor histidine kinase n=1 Tax=Priestia flexa TaxID=86664 RepID=UPI002E1DA601|nr:ATP-binding protein [Priestia flexa]